jgi:hypothetical protein
MRKHYDVAVTKKSIALLVENIKRIATKIREKKSLDLHEVAVCLAFSLRTALKKSLNVDSFFTLVNKNTRFFTHRSSEFVRVYNTKNEKKMTDIRYAVYQRTVMHYDAASQFAADVACFACDCEISEKVHAMSKKRMHSLVEVQTSKLVDHVSKHSSLKTDIDTLSKYCSKK